MTTTPELHELAKDPQAFDTVLEGLHSKRAGLDRTIETLTSKMHTLTGDKKSYRNTRVPVWGRSDQEVKTELQRRAAHDDLEAMTVLRDRAGQRALRAAVDFEIGNMDAVYMRAGNRWTRFFPSVTKSQPHIHRGLNCRTLHPTTVMTWAPQLSGKTDEVAVAELDEALCSVCFPDAPVALHEYVSRKSQAAQDERKAEKDVRDAKRAAKTLTDAEQAEIAAVQGYWTRSERITTVAGALTVIREAIETEVELEYWTQAAAGTRSVPNWTPELLTRRVGNLTEKLAELVEVAGNAASVLMVREQRHEGHGATMEAIAKVRTSKERSARKEWGL